MSVLKWRHTARKNNTGRLMGNTWEATIGRFRVWIVDSHIHNPGNLTAGGSGPFDLERFTEFTVDDLPRVQREVEAAAVSVVRDMAKDLAMMGGD